MILILILLFLFILIIANFIQYNKSSYYNVTNFPYLKVLFNKGRNGEYTTYKNLKSFEKDGSKFLFNIYVPKSNGETTEIDVLMISPKGIFVFESKNYSGWIFGNESQLYWYQILPKGKGKSQKEQFYNPIKQNQSHIKHLKENISSCVPIYSIIVFSNRCTLKNINVSSDDKYVIKRNCVNKLVNSIYKVNNDVLSLTDIDDIYNTLYPFTQVDDSIKIQHIENINNNMGFSRNEDVSQNEAFDQPQNDDEKNNTEETNTDLFEELMFCPKCKSKLVLRTARRGDNKGEKFYGCSNYPKCRYIQKIDN